jgi:type VI secretion system secreted protein VgrG
MPAAITLQSPLPAADLFIESMTVEEGLSQMGSIQLHLLSPKNTIAAADLLGKPVGVTLTDVGDHKRFFHGHVTRFGHGAARGRFHAYHAEVRPWPWFLTRTSDCRIFQAMSVPDIVKQVCNDHPGVAQLKFKLFRSYRKWDYCVQYRETDFQFISRLLEHEGIYWFIAHESGKHTLTLLDAISAHDPVGGTASIRHIEDPSTAPPDEQFVSNWRFDEEIQTEKVALTSYDFVRPSTSLGVDTQVSRSHPQNGAERFDFQGDYIQSADGKQLAEDLLDAAQTRFQRYSGEGNAMNLEAGHTFTLAKHPRADQNAKYLITRVRIDAQVAVFDAGAAGASFKASFEAIPASQQFRAPRTSTKPFVQGPQTAVVVGPSGDEIFTDKYGRVKVQFHWDRLGKKDDKSSCWVRVSHPWAGKNFGMIHTPRIGQEVVVSFLEGDPDQPLITGRVYNAEQMPPWELPANATQSGILTRSSKGGAYGNANAIRFEDKKGSEQLWIHAEKNQDIEVENDETHWVGHDRTKTVDHDEKVHVKHDRTETVDNDETIVVHHDRNERVDNDEGITIGRDRVMLVERDKTETVVRNKSITVAGRHLETIAQTMEIAIGASLSETVAINYSETVGAAMEQTVGGAMAITVGGAMAQSVGAAWAVTVGANLSLTSGGSYNNTVGGSASEKIGAARTMDVAKDDKVTVGGQHILTVAKECVVQAKKIQLQAEDELSIKVGSAELIMKKNGDITLSGGKINVKGSGDVTIKGSKIAGN